MDTDRSNIKLSCPSNSISGREERKTKAKNIIKTKAVKRKKSFGKQFTDLFVGADGGNMSTYVIQDIVIPTAKGIIRDVTEAITDAIKNGIEMQLFGEHSNRRDSRRSGYYSESKPRVNYTNYSESSYSRPNRQKPTYGRPAAKNKQFDEVVVESHREASDVIQELMSRLHEYNEVSVEDLHDLVGITSEFVDGYYGWYNLNTARVKRVRDGYMIDLPKPVHLQS